MKSQGLVHLKGLSRFSNQDEQNMLYFSVISTGFSLFSNFFLSFGNSNISDNVDPRRFQAILWLIAGGTRGGPNRIRMLYLLRTKSLNAHQISKELNLDHKTIKHHINVLVKNSLISKSENVDYGATYTLTSIMTENIPALEEIVSKIRRKNA